MRLIVRQLSAIVHATIGTGVLVSGVVIALTVGLASCGSANPTYVPHDRALRELPLYFYPSTTSDAPKAVLFFFGNDVGFWESHERLALRLADRGYDVIGFDVKQYLNSLPHDPTVRAHLFQRRLDSIVVRSTRELHADSLPLVLGGHSFGASLAVWAAAHAAPPHCIGVLAMAPTLRSHFFVTAADLANLHEPDEPGSFSIAEQVRAIPPTLRVALIRGSHDKRMAGDSTIRAAGGTRLDYTVIPLSGHSLKALTLAGPMIGDAMDWIVQGK